MVSIGLNAQSGEFFRNSVELDFAFLFASPRYLRIQHPEYEESYGEIWHRQEFNGLMNVMGDK